MRFGIYCVMKISRKKRGTRTAAGILLTLISTVCCIQAVGAVPLYEVPRNNTEELYLVPGGMPFGVSFESEGVTVVGIGEVVSGGVTRSPAKDAGFTEKDIILSMNGEKVTDAQKLSEIIDSVGGEAIRVSVRREGREILLYLTPVQSDSDGRYRAGLFIREGTAGIGTVTYIDRRTGCFAGLGHGICEPDSGELIPVKRGSVVNVAISGVIKGKNGHPGELQGYFSSGKIGTLFSNKDCGVYGVFCEYPQGVCNEAVPIAASDEIREGDAEILCTTGDDGIGRYGVSLSHIDRSGRNVKNFVVTVTDPNLLSRTGGIVQGMSGSPIMQDGKLIGAVTHVLVNDPTRGYGIFIENMLSEGEKT